MLYKRTVFILCIVFFHDKHILSYKELVFCSTNLNNYPYLQAVRFYSAGGEHDEHSNSQHQLLSVADQQNKRRYWLQARDKPCYIQAQMWQRIIHGQRTETDGGYLRHYDHKSTERGLKPDEERINH